MFLNLPTPRWSGCQLPPTSPPSAPPKPLQINEHDDDPEKVAVFGVWVHVLHVKTLRQVADIVIKQLKKPWKDWETGS
ncbi:hypothetical protein GW17_00027367 [Ensete ventricosum]|nr:hypothetical protein GW17_00027367 [Ensete ventricosum]